MGNHSVYEPSTSGREVHLSSLDYDDIMTRMNNMKLALNENQKVVENLKLANKQLIKDLTMECGVNRLHNEYAEKKDKEFKDLSKYFNCEINKLTDRTEEAERKRNVLLGKFDFLEKNKQTLEEKVCQLEKKLYARDQSDQTIHLNKPKEFRFFKSKWGIGYPNPQSYAKSVKLVPTLYDFNLMDLGTRVPQLALKWTEMSEEDREKEEIRRNQSTKMKLPFCYDNLNGDTYDKRIPTKPTTLSNDYFHSYSTTELEAQPIEGKLYVPPLILESKIVQLEEKLEINQYIFEVEKEFLMTILLNHESESFSKLEDIPESNESILSDSDASSCKAFIGSSILKDVSSEDDSNLTANQKECKESFISQSHITNYNNWVEGARKVFGNRNETRSVINEPSISSSNEKALDMDVSSESDLFKDSLDSCLFDFNTTLPDHSSFLFNTKEIPSECCKGESSKTIGKVVPETSLKNEGKTKRKSRKRSKKKKSLKPTSQATNFSKPSSSGNLSNVTKRVKQEWRPKLPTSDVGSTKKSVTNIGGHNVINSVKHNRASYFQKQSVVFPSTISNIKHLMKFSQNLIRCSNCWSDRFVDKRVSYNHHYYHHHAYTRQDNYDSHYYNRHSYYHYNHAHTPYLYRKPGPSFTRIPTTDPIANRQGPIFKWVPKTV